MRGSHSPVWTVIAGVDEVWSGQKSAPLRATDCFLGDMAGDLYFVRNNSSHPYALGDDEYSKLVVTQSSHERKGCLPSMIRLSSRSMVILVTIFRG
jgi:hypothetical protein